MKKLAIINYNHYPHDKTNTNIFEIILFTSPF